MTKKKILGILSLGLLIFAFMLGPTTPGGYCLGDNILRFFGFKAWSLESAQHRTNGFHYTFLFTVGFAILGYAGTKHYLKEAYPRLVKRLSSIVLVLLLTSSQLFMWGYGLALSFSQGINAVEYLPAKSNCQYEFNPATGLTTCSYQITLKNYANNEVKFNLKVQKPSRDDDIMSDVADQNLEGHKIIKEFTLLPKEQNVFRFVIEDRTPYLLFGSGSISRPNITIYNQESSREFMGR